MVEDSQETTHFGFQTVAKEQKAEVIQDDEYRSEEDENALEDNEFIADRADEAMSGEPSTPR